MMLVSNYVVMGSDCWQQRLEGGGHLTIRQQAGSENGDLYAVDVPAKFGSEITTIQTDAAQIVETNRSSPNSDSLRLIFEVPDTSTVERVRVAVADIHFVVFLPSTEFLRVCEEIRNGSGQALDGALSEFSSVVQFVIACGGFHEIPDFIELVDSIATMHGSSALHSYRYAIIRSALTPGPGPTVTSKDELEALVEGLDGVDRIGGVTLLEALGDLIATVYENPKEVDALLSDLGFDIRPLERSQDGSFFAIYLAHLVDSSGLEAAEAAAMKRNWRIGGNYERRKKKAKNAEFEQRASLWRSLVCAAARQGVDEFAYALSNALYWSCRVWKSGSRVDDLLLSATTKTAQEAGATTIEARARFEKHRSSGHRLRSSHNFRPAIWQFEHAEELAKTHEFLPRWHARHSRGLCESHYFFDQGNHEKTIQRLEDTIDTLSKFDIEDARLNELTNHLEAQKYERLGDIAQDGIEAVEHYETAISGFDAVEFERSQERCREKKTRIQQRLDTEKAKKTTQSAETSVTETEEPESSKATEKENSEETDAGSGASTDEGDAATPQRTRESGFLPPEIRVAETGFYDPLPEDERESLGAPLEPGSEDPSVIPDDDEESRNSDPYIF